jgi:hypothetical protein
MDGQLKMRAPTNYLVVDLDDPDEVEYWLVVLDTTRPRLEEAVALNGPWANSVRAYLHQPAQMARLDRDAAH